MSFQWVAIFAFAAFVIGAFIACYLSFSAYRTVDGELDAALSDLDKCKLALLRAHVRIDELEQAAVMPARNAKTGKFAKRK